MHILEISHCQLPLFVRGENEWAIAVQLVAAPGQVLADVDQQGQLYHRDHERLRVEQSRQSSQHALVAVGTLSQELLNKLDILGHVPCHLVEAEPSRFGKRRECRPGHLLPELPGRVAVRHDGDNIAHQPGRVLDLDVLTHQIEQMSHTADVEEIAHVQVVLSLYS